MTTEDMSWLANAICKGKTALFFIPPRNESKRDRLRRESIAVTYCAQCPVITECRDYARRNNELGIWGGETEEMRWRAGYLRNTKDTKWRQFSKRHGKTIVQQTAEPVSMTVESVDTKYQV